MSSMDILERITAFGFGIVFGKYIAIPILERIERWISHEH